MVKKQVKFSLSEVTMEKIRALSTHHSDLNLSSVVTLAVDSYVTQEYNKTNKAILYFDGRKGGSGDK